MFKKKPSNPEQNSLPTDQANTAKRAAAEAESSIATPLGDKPDKGYTAPKGRATPSRAKSEAANRRPLVPKDRKAARKQDRAERDRIWRLQQDAMRTGDERYLPYNHRGPVRRYIRDYIDARYSLGELFLPAAILLLLLMFIAPLPPFVGWAPYAMLGLYILVLIAMVDAVVLAWRVVGKTRKKFADAPLPKWSRFYAFTRAMYWRRLRLPAPLVKRGEYPA